MTSSSSRRPMITLVALSICLFFLGVNGLIGGYLMLKDPNGTPMGLPPNALSRTLFQNYIIPGLCLILIWGGGSFVTLAGLWFRPAWLANSPLTRWTHEHWAWDLSVLMGVGLFIWLTYQLFTLPDFAVIQVILYILAVLLIVLPLAPGMRRFYSLSMAKGV